VWEMHAAGQAGKLPMIDFDTRRPLTEAALQDLARWPHPSAEDALANADCACHDHGVPVNAECSRCSCFMCWDGAHCDVRNHEGTFCANDCSENGLCVSGFCQCKVRVTPTYMPCEGGARQVAHTLSSQVGFFGVDCSLTLGADGTVLTSYQRWAAANPGLVSPPKAEVGSTQSMGPRAKIYVYELPPQFTSHLLYAHHPLEYNSIYSAGRFLHMRLLASEYRTTDPSDADFYFVPVWARAAGSGPPRYRSKYLIEVLGSLACFVLPLSYSDAKVANRYGKGFRVGDRSRRRSRRPPISLNTFVARTEG
jgi:hypothetical protein